MIIAGLDVATTTGISILSGDQLLHAEAFRPKGKTNVEVNSGFRQHLTAVFAAYEVEYVAAEEPLVTDLKNKSGEPMLTMQTYRRIYGLHGVLEELCGTKNYPLQYVHQATWRKAFLGTGRGDKDMAVAQCALLSKQRGWPAIKSKDIAESIGVAWWLAGHLRIAQLARPDELFAPASIGG